MAFVTAVHLITCLLLIGVVLLQHGKGADLGATFGGSGNTVFGASGADNLFTRMTTGLAVVFMTTSIVLASNVTPEGNVSGSIFKELPKAAAAAKADDGVKSKNDVSEDTPASAEASDDAKSADAKPEVEPVTAEATDPAQPEAIAEEVDVAESATAPAVAEANPVQTKAEADAEPLKADPAPEQAE